MRRLPVYILLDTSGSMMGEPIEAVKNGLQTLVATLRQDPYALETAFLSVITFDTDARQLMPLTELSAFQIPTLMASGATALGAALRTLVERSDIEVQKSTTTIKGDWKPIVFIMTDGSPTDDLEKGLAEFRKRRFGVVVACGAGPKARLDLLKKITPDVVQLDTADARSITAFFKWVSASIGVSSQKIDSGAKEITGLDELPPPPPEINFFK